ncbi:MAG: hypothetical protein M1829_006625, partial [Trizodia sp. TS-e1964]
DINTEAPLELSFDKRGKKSKKKSAYTETADEDINTEAPQELSFGKVGKKSKKTPRYSEDAYGDSIKTGDDQLYGTAPNNEIDQSYEPEDTQPPTETSRGKGGKKLKKKTGYSEDAYEDSSKAVDDRLHGPASIDEINQSYTPEGPPREPQKIVKIEPNPISELPHLETADMRQPEYDNHDDYAAKGKTRKSYDQPEEPRKKGGKKSKRKSESTKATTHDKALIISPSAFLPIPATNPELLPTDPPNDINATIERANDRSSLEDLAAPTHGEDQLQNIPISPSHPTALILESSVPVSTALEHFQTQIAIPSQPDIVRDHLSTSPPPDTNTPILTMAQLEPESPLVLSLAAPKHSDGHSQTVTIDTNVLDQRSSEPDPVNDQSSTSLSSDTNLPLIPTTQLDPESPFTIFLANPAYSEGHSQTVTIQDYFEPDKDKDQSSASRSIGTDILLPPATQLAPEFPVTLSLTAPTKSADTPQAIPTMVSLEPDFVEDQSSTSLFADVDTPLPPMTHLAPVSPVSLSLAAPTHTEGFPQTVPSQNSFEPDFEPDFDQNQLSNSLSTESNALLPSMKQLSPRSPVALSLTAPIHSEGHSETAETQSSPITVLEQEPSKPVLAAPEFSQPQFATPSQPDSVKDQSPTSLSTKTNDPIYPMAQLAPQSDPSLVTPQLHSDGHSQAILIQPSLITALESFEPPEHFQTESATLGQPDAAKDRSSTSIYLNTNVPLPPMTQQAPESPSALSLVTPLTQSDGHPRAVSIQPSDIAVLDQKSSEPVSAENSQPQSATPSKPNFVEDQSPTSPYMEANVPLPPITPRELGSPAALSLAASPTLSEGYCRAVSIQPSEIILLDQESSEPELAENFQPQSASPSGPKSVEDQSPASLSMGINVPLPPMTPEELESPAALSVAASPTLIKGYCHAVSILPSDIIVLDQESSAPASERFQPELGAAKDNPSTYLSVHTNVPPPVIVPETPSTFSLADIEDNDEAVSIQPSHIIVESPAPVLAASEHFQLEPDAARGKLSTFLHTAANAPLSPTKLLAPRSPVALPLAAPTDTEDNSHAVSIQPSHITALDQESSVPASEHIQPEPDTAKDKPSTFLSTDSNAPLSLINQLAPESPDIRSLPASPTLCDGLSRAVSVQPSLIAALNHESPEPVLLAPMHFEPQSASSSLPDPVKDQSRTSLSTKTDLPLPSISQLAPEPPATPSLVFASKSNKIEFRKSLESSTYGEALPNIKKDRRLSLVSCEQPNEGKKYASTSPRTLRPFDIPIKSATTITSPTAVPLNLPGRRPFQPPAFSRLLTTGSPEAGNQPAHASPARPRQSRAGSKNANEYRPLLLVERHIPRNDAEFDVSPSTPAGVSHGKNFAASSDLEPRHTDSSKGLGQSLPVVDRDLQPSPSILNLLSTVDMELPRPNSRGSNVSSGTPPLRHVNRSISGDLRAASKRAQAKLVTKQAKRELSTSTLTTEPQTRGIGSSTPQAMTSIYEGWGDVSGSPMSPTRPPSVRRRQSMQIIDLESKVDQLASDNRLLQDVKSNYERELVDARQKSTRQSETLTGVIRSRDALLREKDMEMVQLRGKLDWLQNEVARLTEINDSIGSASVALAALHEQHSSLQTEHANKHLLWEQTSRELEDLREHHGKLLAEVDSMRNESQSALEEKNRQLSQMHEELEAAKEQVRTLQLEILASKPSDSFLTIRDEDYFDSACQHLCQHAQQWVLRFSKFSDMRGARLTDEIEDEKTTERLDNSILDGSEVDDYLADRIKRRDVFMSMVMAMVWEFIFTRYLFGMDREQRQKLKSLEKILTEVGPASAVHHWRATTLTLLSKRKAFLAQREDDTEAVTQEIFHTLSAILPPPSHLRQQIHDSLRNVIRSAVDLSIEMRTQRPEYMMLPPLKPEFDSNGNLLQTVPFNASLMNERSGDTYSNEALEAQGACVRMVLFPLVVKRGDDNGAGDEEIVVCPAQVLVAKPAKDKKVARMLSSDPMSVDQRSTQSLTSTMDLDNMI